MYKKIFMLTFSFFLFFAYIDVSFASSNKEVTITISNLDKTDGNYIENTFYEILNLNDELIYSFVTKKEPFIIKDNFKTGKYKLREIKSSNKYKNNKDETYFEISENTSNKDIKIYSIMDSEINVPSTSSFKSPLKYIIGFVTIFLGICLILKYFYSNKEV